MALHRFARNTLFSTLAGFSTAIGSFIASVVVARILGPVGSGAVALALWIVATAVTAGDCGVPLTLSRFLPDLDARGLSAQGAALESALRPVLLLTTAAGALLAGGLYLITSRYPPGYDFEALPFDYLPRFVWLAIGAVFVAQALGNLVLGRLRGQQKFTTTAKMAVGSFGLQVSSVAVFSLLFGAPGAILGFAAGSLLPMLWLTRRPPASAPLDPVLRRRAWRFAVNSWGAGLVSTIVWSRSELAFLSYWRGAHEAGYYAVALTLCQIATQAPLLMTGSLLALFSERQGLGDRAGLARAYGSSIRFMAAMLMPACFGMAAITPVLLPLFFGHAFDEAIDVASFLIAVQAFGALSTVSTMLLFAAERGQFIVKIGLVGALVLIASGVTIIPMFGLFGTAMARATIQIALAVGAFVYIERALDYPAPWRAMGRIMAAATGCALVARLIVMALPNGAGLILALIVGVASYCVLIRFCRALQADDLLRLQSLTAKLPARARRCAEAVLHWLSPTSPMLKAG